MEAEKSVRVDKFLWAVRIYKTRSIAADACKNGRVLIAEYQVKPSRMLKVGEIFEVKQNPIFRRFKIIDVLENRVGAKLVANYIEDITPESELKKLEALKEHGVTRERGAGRPTKKERRDIDGYFDF